MLRSICRAVCSKIGNQDAVERASKFTAALTRRWEDVPAREGSMRLVQTGGGICSRGSCLATR